MKKLEIDEMGRMDCEEFKSSVKLPVKVILDNIRSLYNVGSVFRTSDAFRIDEIILCGITATPENSLVEIHKTALGAEETVRWRYETDCLQVVRDLVSSGFQVIAVEQVRDSIKLEHFVAEKGMKYALVFGNEVKGISQQVVDECCTALEIPQFGTKHSLNVSVSAGIVIWEMAKQLEELLD
ncbi:MAG: RNA methyltransferase [Bacteroidaceae bacterium]|nr:RNA methyltransferase [Bacteroidaceae bacterium]